MFPFLAEVTGDNMKSSEDDITSAIEPLLKLLCLTVIGLVLAHRKVQIIPKATFKLLSRLVFALFLPCLIFTHLGQSITLKNFAHWWFIPINVLISTFVGCLLGILVVIVCRPPPNFTRFTIVMTAFGNTGNLPLAIVGSVCRTEDSFFGPDCHKKGVAYVSFAQWVAMILVYTLVYHMMEPPAVYYEMDEEGCQNEQQRQGVEMRIPLLVEAEDKGTKYSEAPFVARIFKSISNVSDRDHVEEASVSSPWSISSLTTPKVVRKIQIVAEQTPMQHILLPPTIVSLLAIIVGVTPQIKDFVFGYDAPLSFLTDSLEILAGAMVPSVMLILGGMLAEGPNESKLGIRTTIGIIVARLLILPLLGIGIVMLADKLHLLVEGDKMYRFVLLLQYTTPSAILLGAIASLQGYAVSESSALLFWQHLFALVSLSLYLVTYFKLLSFV